MDKNIWLLLRVRFISQQRLNIFKVAGHKKEKSKRLIYLICLAIIALMASFYSGAIAYGLGYLNMTQLIPLYAFLIASLLSFFFTIFKANGELFGFFDYDTLMSLPIKTTTIIASRFMYLYIWNTLLSLLIMLPAGVIYAVFSNPNRLFYCFWIIAMFTVTLIPTTIATIIGAVITAIASRTKHASLISTVLMIMLLISILAASLFAGGFNQSFDINQLNDLSRIFINESFKIYPIAELYHNGIVEEKWLQFISFIAISIVWYLLFVKVLSFKYKSLNTRISSTYNKSNYEVNRLNSGNVLTALYSKELKRFLSSTIYVTNMVVGLVMSVIMSVAVVIVGSERLAIMVGLPELVVFLPKLTPFILAAMIGMSNTSSVSLSLEGKNLWILKSLPLRLRDIYLSKILVNLTLTVPVALISGSLFIIGIKATLYQGLMMLVIPLIFAIFSATWGLFINYQFANYDWESETQVVKQSMSAVIGMLGSLLIAVILGSVSVFLNDSGYAIYTTSILLLLLGASHIMFKLLLKKRL